MSYVGVKFKTEFVNRKLPEDPRLEELKNWGQKFHLKGLTPIVDGYSTGNLSLRTEKAKDQFIITATGLSLKDELTNDCFVKIESVDLTKKIIQASGLKKPSSETIFHAAIYQQREEVNAIFHGHCQEILTQNNKLKIPETKKEQPYGTVELVQSILDILDDHFFLIIKNHGFIALGRDMTQAGEIALAIIDKCENK